MSQYNFKRDMIVTNIFLGNANLKLSHLVYGTSVFNSFEFYI